MTASESNRQALLAPIKAFLHCETPAEWIAQALQELPLLLVDHANCEKKAASTALHLLYRYVDKPDLLNKLSRLAREELRHFEQVLAVMDKRGIAYDAVGPARYAAGLREHVRTHDPARLIDTLIVGAYIEARSCERFAALAPHLDADLAQFYTSLLRSEARHYEDYLSLAQRYSDEPIDERIAFFGEKEAELVLSPDPEFRFHSGMPLAAG